MSKALVMNIKGDLEQTCKRNESNVKHLEMKFDEYTKQNQQSNSIIKHSIEEINHANEINDEKLKTLKDRIGYLQRVIKANNDDQRIFKDKLVEIAKMGEEKKEEHQRNLEKQKANQIEMENELQMEIQDILSQLKNFRGFQEQRHQLDQQIRTLRNLIDTTKKNNHQEITEIRHKILDQRTFYEEDLKTRLVEARQFAKDFSDLHMDLVTQKIAEENIENRNALKQDMLQSIENLRKNDELRKKWIVVERDFKINQENVGKIAKDYAALKVQCKEYEEKLETITQENRQRLMQLKDETEFSLNDHQQDLLELKKRNEELKKEAALAARQLKRAEAKRFEAFKKEVQFLDQMNQSASFLLTSISKAMPLDENTDNDDQLNVHRSELSKLMRRLQAVSEKMKQNTLIYPNYVETADAETQTDKLLRTDYLSGKVSAPPIKPGVNPRRTIYQAQRKPGVYKRLYESSKKIPPLRKKVLSDLTSA